jgi:hypothetical protein
MEHLIHLLLLQLMLMEHLLHQQQAAQLPLLLILMLIILLLLVVEAADTVHTDGLMAVEEELEVFVQLSEQQAEVELLNLL